MATPPSPDHAPMARRPVVLGEGRLQDGQAARGQQRPADALQGARRDQHPHVRGQAAEQRGEGEPHGADHEHPAPPVAVAERPAEQQQAGQRQRVGVHHPLQAGHPGVEVPPDGRDRDADHGRVQGGHARAEHGGGHHPPAPRARHPQAGRRRCPVPRSCSSASPGKSAIMPGGTHHGSFRIIKEQNHSERAAVQCSLLARALRRPGSLGRVARIEPPRIATKAMPMAGVRCSPRTPTPSATATAGLT